jgi:hypothetical protein
MIVFEAGRQAKKVRALWIGTTLVTLAASLLTVVLLFDSLGAPDPAVARARVGIAFFFVVLTGAITGGLAVYGRCYVTRLVLEKDRVSMTVRTLGMLHDRSERLPLYLIEGTGSHDGERGRVDAPWWTIRLEHRMLPLIIDAQGDVRDLPGLLTVLLAPAAPTPE